METTQGEQQQKRGRGRPRGGTTEPERVARAHEANRRRGQETKALELIEAGWLVVAPEDVSNSMFHDACRAIKAPWRERAEQRREERRTGRSAR